MSLTFGKTMTIKAAVQQIQRSTKFGGYKKCRQLLSDAAERIELACDCDGDLEKVTEQDVVDTAIEMADDDAHIYG